MLGTYLRTWATVLGPYHWPMDLPSPTPICAAGNRAGQRHTCPATPTPLPAPHRGRSQHVWREARVTGSLPWARAPDWHQDASSQRDRLLLKMSPPHRPALGSRTGDMAQASEFRALPAPPSTGGDTTLRSWIKTQERPDCRPEPGRTSLQGHQVGVQRRGASQHFTTGPGPSPPCWPAPHSMPELSGTRRRSVPRHGPGALPPPTYLVDGVAAVLPVQERVQDAEVAVRLPRPPCPPPVYGRHRRSSVSPKYRQEGFVFLRHSRHSWYPNLS